MDVHYFRYWISPELRFGIPVPHWLNQAVEDAYGRTPPLALAVARG